MSFFPPFGPPGGPPGLPPSGPGALGVPGGVPGGPPQPPAGPPPQMIPPQPAISPFAIDPGAISRCLFRFTYIWPRRGPGFWFYPVFVGRTSISGFRWNGFAWIFSGFDLQSIESFSCF